MGGGDGADEAVAAGRGECKTTARMNGDKARTNADTSDPYHAVRLEAPVELSESRAELMVQARHARFSAVARTMQRCGRLLRLYCGLRRSCIGPGPSSTLRLGESERMVWAAAWCGLYCTATRPRPPTGQCGTTSVHWSIGPGP
jgi:hypothetical protein